MGARTLDIFVKGRSMVKALISGQMERHIKVNGDVTKSMAKENIHGQMGDATREVGSKTNCMEEVSIRGLMGGSTKENTIKMKNMDLDFMSGQTENHTRAIGAEAFVMDKVSSVTQRGNSELGSGSKETGKNGSLAA